MREIKFRAWDKILKEWNTTFLVDSKGLVYKNCRDLEDGTNTFDLELIQFTGIKDKNGKEICKGDILDTRFGQFTIYDIISLYKDIEILDQNKIEIIGNIYEYSHLLNK